MIVAAVALLAAGAVSAAPLQWEKAFAVTSARGGVELTAVFADRQGREHRVQLWREAGRLRRDTDETRIFAERTGGEASYVVEQRAQKRAFHVSEANLSRAGLRAGWDGLASLLQRPAGKAAVARVEGAAVTTRFGPCELWEVLGKGVRVCWSVALALPLRAFELREGAWKPALRIERLRRGTIEPSVWAVPRGVQVIDLDGELDHGGD